MLDLDLLRLYSGLDLERTAELHTSIRSSGLLL